MNRYMNQYFATRRRLKVGLVVAGAASGSIAGAALTVLGKIVAGAPPPTPANYAWNMAVFGVMAAVASPIVTWSALRRAPLWRTVVEPLAAGLAGAGIGVLMGSGVALLVLAPLGAAAALTRLGRAYRDQE